MTDRVRVGIEWENLEAWIQAYGASAQKAAQIQALLNLKSYVGSGSFVYVFIHFLIPKEPTRGT